MLGINGGRPAAPGLNNLNRAKREQVLRQTQFSEPTDDMPVPGMEGLQGIEGPFAVGGVPALYEAHNVARLAKTPSRCQSRQTRSYDQDIHDCTHLEENRVRTLAPNSVPSPRTLGNPYPRNRAR
jgi:hypothetical protein